MQRVRRAQPELTIFGHRTACGDRPPPGSRHPVFSLPRSRSPRSTRVVRGFQGRRQPSVDPQRRSIRERIVRPKARRSSSRSSVAQTIVGFTSVYPCTRTLRIPASGPSERREVVGAVSAACRRRASRSGRARFGEVAHRARPNRGPERHRPSGAHGRASRCRAAPGREGAGQELLPGARARRYPRADPARARGARRLHRAGVRPGDRRTARDPGARGEVRRTPYVIVVALAIATIPVAFSPRIGATRPLPFVKAAARNPCRSTSSAPRHAAGRRRYTRSSIAFASECGRCLESRLRGRIEPILLSPTLPAALGASRESAALPGRSSMADARS